MIEVWKFLLVVGGIMYNLKIFIVCCDELLFFIDLNCIGIKIGINVNKVYIYNLCFKGGNLIFL